MDPNSTAAIIDTTGNVDVLRIYTVLLSRLRRNSELCQKQAALHDTKDLTIEELAAKVLDRVKIMRVFDLIGVVEAVSEIKGELEGISNPSEVQHLQEEKSEPKAALEQKVAKRTVVEDSEDEDDNMLFDLDSPPPVITTSPPPNAKLIPQEGSVEASNQGFTVGQTKTSFILVDNLAHVLSPLLKKDYIQGTRILSPYFHLSPEAI